MTRNTSTTKIIAASSLLILSGGIFVNKASAEPSGTLTLDGNVPGACQVLAAFDKTTYGVSETKATGASGGETQLTASDQIAIDCNSETVSTTVNLSRVLRPTATNASNLVADHTVLVVTTGASPVTNVNNVVTNAPNASLVNLSSVATNANGDLTIDITSTFAPPATGGVEDGAIELHSGAYGATFVVTVTPN